MKAKYLLLIIVLIFNFQMNIHAENYSVIKPSDANIKYFGRFDKTGPDALQYTWPGVYFKFKLNY